MRKIGEVEFHRRKRQRRPIVAALLMLLCAVVPAVNFNSDDASASALSVQVQLNNGKPQLVWASTSGQSYNIEVATNLSQNGWTNAATVPAAGATTSWTDPLPLVGTRFYRVVFPVQTTPALVTFTHASQSNGIPDLATATFASVRDRLNQMIAAGGVTLPVPVAGLSFFDNIPLSNAIVQIDDLQRTLVISGGTTLHGQSVDLMFVGLWKDDTSAATGFNLGVKFPQFHLSDWASGLSGTVLDNLTLDSSVLTLATAPMNLDLSGFTGNVAGFYGGPTLTVQPGLNIHRQVNLAEAPGLAQPLGWLGFTDLTVLLEGYLGIDPNVLFHPGGPTPALQLDLQAYLPVSQPPGFPGWLRPIQRILEFTDNPAFRVRLLDTLEATPDGQKTRFTASTDIDTTGGQTSVTLVGSLADPWVHPFGISWLTLNQANVSLTFSTAGAGQATLTGNFPAGSTSINTAITLTQAGTNDTASFVATASQINLGDVLQLFSSLTGSSPFGSGLPDDALVLNNVQLSFNSSDERSVSLSATSTILGSVQTDVLFSFAQPDSGPSLFILGMHVHDFKLSALYSGIDGSFAGDTEFPGIAFTVMQNVPNPPSGPIEIPSTGLSSAALNFYQPIYGAGPFNLEVKPGVNFSGTFAQSALPSLVQDALGMDPNGTILLKGSLELSLRDLTGGGLVALNSLHLDATLPPPTRPRVGLPDWISTPQPGARTLDFTYVSPDIQVAITDTFQVNIDGAYRTFVTSTMLATDGHQAALTITGNLVGGWSQPFGVDWLNLDTVGLVVNTDGTNASAALNSTFQLGSKNVALAMSISGNASNQLVQFTGTVDTLSLSDFIDLAQKQLGADAAPFGDSTFDFTFTNVTMAIETGSHNSFSLGGQTTLDGKLADVLFSAEPQPGGGPPQIVTGFEMQNWSLGDALSQLAGTFPGDFQFQTVALVFSKTSGSINSSDMDPETRSFYGNIYGTNNFTLPSTSGLSAIGAVPLQGNPLKNGLDALGMSADSLFLTGTVPGSILGLGGGGGGLSGLSLVAALPPISPPGAPDWFVSGQVGLQITSEPSVGFVGDITVKIQGQVLTFNASATIERVGASVSFVLTGGLAAQQPWVDPFGIQWLTFNDATIEVGVNEIGSITLGFEGNMVIGQKDIDAAVAVTLSAVGVPVNFIFDGTSAEGFSVADLVTLQQQMAAVDNPSAPMIPLDTMPDMAVRNLHLKFAPHSDPNLGVTAGFAVAGDLWIPSQANGPPDRDFASVNISVDTTGIIAQGNIGPFTLGSLSWSNATCNLTLTVPTQQLLASGTATAGSFFQGALDLSLTKSGLSFSTTTTIYNQYQAQLSATAPFSLSNAQFTVQGLMQSDFATAIVPTLTQLVKTEANGSTTVANNMLKRGLPGWTAFRSNPDTDFADVITGFASAAGWPSSDWSPYINAIQSAMNTILNASPSTPSDLLGLALGGTTTAGVPGIKTTICVRRQLVPPFACLQTQDLCNGVPYGGGPCWTVPPVTIGGVCHDASLVGYNIPCSTTPFIEQILIPPLISRIDTILQNKNKSPMIVLQQAGFTSSLDNLVSTPSVNLATSVEFMQSATPLNLQSAWNFSNQSTSLNAMRDALVSLL